MSVGSNYSFVSEDGILVSLEFLVVEQFSTRFKQGLWLIDTNQIIITNEQWDEWEYLVKEQKAKQ